VSVITLVALKAPLFRL